MIKLVLSSLLSILFAIVSLSLSAQDLTTLLNQQRKIISQLSGHTALDNGKLLAARSTKIEREDARQQIAKELATLGLKPKFHNYRMPNVNPLVDLLVNPFKGANVYTILPATIKSDDYIVIGAHYDSKRNCPGAIDNASGVAISYGAISKLNQLKERKVNIILVYFDQEEEELVGSQAFAKKLKKENLNVLSVHTLDTMGWDRDGDFAVELELPTEYLKQIYSKSAEKLGIPLHITKVNSTDHHSFRALGFNAVGLTDEFVNGDYAPYKDTEKDTYNTVNFNFIASCTNLLYNVLKTEIQ